MSATPPKLLSYLFNGLIPSGQVMVPLLMHITDQMSYLCHHLISSAHVELQ